MGKYYYWIHTYLKTLHEYMSIETLIEQQTDRDIHNILHSDKDKETQRLRLRDRETYRRRERDVNIHLSVYHPTVHYSADDTFSWNKGVVFIIQLSSGLS